MTMPVAIASGGSTYRRNRRNRASTCYIESLSEPSAHSTRPVITAPAAPRTTSPVNVAPTSTVTARSRMDWHACLVAVKAFCRPSADGGSERYGDFLLPLVVVMLSTRYSVPCMFHMDRSTNSSVEDPWNIFMNLNTSPSREEL